MPMFAPQRWRCSVPGCDSVDNPTPGGHCQRHACKRATCPWPKVEGSGYCAQHACDLMACSKSRLDTSAFCNLHACQYSGCTVCKRGVGTDAGILGDACDEHTCQAEGCPKSRRLKRPYCCEHSCQWSGRLPCNQAVESGALACRDHVCRFIGGCANVRKIKSNSEACDEHTCAIPRCYHSVDLRGKYCVLHTCLWDPCSKRGGYGGSPYCETHKCGAQTCPSPVMSKIDCFCDHHKCRYNGSDCLGGWTKTPPYCQDHTCAHDGCNGPIRRGGKYCIEHTCTLRLEGQPCTLERKSGGQFCLEHSCSKCTEPRESPDTKRCIRHRKEDIRFVYSPRQSKVDVKEVKETKETKKKPITARHGVGPEKEHRHKDSKARHLSPRRAKAQAQAATVAAATKARQIPPPNMELGVKGPPFAALEEGKGGKHNFGLIPQQFRDDPNHSLAYLYGFRDACLQLAGVTTEQIAMVRPLSPSRHIADIDGPRFTNLDDEKE